MFYMFSISREKYEKLTSFLILFSSVIHLNVLAAEYELSATSDFFYTNPIGMGYLQLKL